MEDLSFRRFTEENPNFALVIDGEVADNFSFPVFPEGQVPEIIEKLIAIFKSDPKVIKVLEYIEPGSTWDGRKFNPPA